MAPTYAGTVASLYADPLDPAFSASGLERPTIEELIASLMRALSADDRDTAEVLSHEVARLTRKGPKALSDCLLSSTPGIWRLH